MTDSNSAPGSYAPRDYQPLRFRDARLAFERGEDSPRDYLERCLETIATRDPVVQAYVCINEDAARKAADESAARWQAGQPLSAIDGMPVSIKDLLETRDMPTQMGCEAYRGNYPKRDNAAVWALRQAGAVVLGKTVTAELGGNHPGPTTNPFQPARTPGGSSSGSAAAVAAGMVPAAIGSQVGGSIIRPAGFCGNVALKPSQGGINRGERQATSMSTHGVHAGCIDDMWRVAMEIVCRVGGDRGHPGLTGPLAPPHAAQPNQIVVLETAGWASLDSASRDAFDDLLEQLRSLGIAVTTRRESRLVEALEAAAAQAGRICAGITAWENRWATRNLVDEHPAGVSDRAKKTLAMAESMRFDDYRHLMALRDQAQRAHQAIAGTADAILSFSCPGPAPLWSGDRPGEPLADRPTGDAVFNYPTSMLFAPCISLPLLAVDGMPVGVQLVGQQQEDARICALSRWLLDKALPVSKTNSSAAPAH